MLYVRPEYVPDTTEQFLRECREARVRRGEQLSIDTVDAFMQECLEEKIRQGRSPIFNRRLK